MRTALSCVSIIAVSAAAAFATEPVRSYPTQCAVDVCDEVVRISSADLPREGSPRVLVISADREAVMAKPFPVFRSTDGRMHACMRYDPFGELVVTCLMLPSSD